MDPRPIVAFTGVFDLVGVFLVAAGFSMRRQEQLAQGWPHVLGRVLESRVVRSIREDSEGNASEVYRATVRYEYEVLGRKLNGDRISLSKWWGRSSQAERLVRRYEVGAHVRVYHHPLRPQESVLEPKTDHPDWLIFFGGIWTAVATSALWWAIHQL